MEVDLEKLICSLLKQADKTGYKLRMSNVIKALKEQGLEYKDGKLNQIVNEPKFKVGQTIIYKGTENIAPTKMTISDIAKGQYWDDNCCIVPISDQDNWELEKPSTIKFEEDPNDVEKLTEVTSQVPHPKMYYRLLRDELPLMKEGQYIVTERVQVETLQEFRNKAASLEESKLFLPLLDSEIERLLNLERLHLSRIAGFVVPKEIRFIERH